jgi:hypothetical protein
MTLSMYQASVPVFVRQLTALSKILDKAIEQSAAGTLNAGTLLAARLAPDMFALPRQIQIATDGAKGAARLGHIEIPAFADEEVTFDDLKQRIAKTIAFLQTITPEQIDGSEERVINLKAGPRELTFSGQDFLLGFVLPNFFFHVTVAYSLLRQGGVTIGKLDYLGAS